MKAIERKLLETLEPAGLAFIIRGALGRSEMVRIANASRVSIPGMRNRAVSLEHLSESLADKFVAEGPSRRLMVKALQGAVRSAAPSYRKLAAEEVRQRLQDVERLRADPELARLLFLLLAEPKDGIGSEEIRTAASEALRSHAPREPDTGTAASLDGEVAALRREKTELSRRAGDLVALVDRLRERDRRFREEIAQRKFDISNLKLQIARHKKDRESLEKEMRALNARIDQTERRPQTLEGLPDKVAAVLAETRRLAAALEKLQTRILKEDRTQGSLARSLEELRGDLQRVSRQASSDRDRIVKTVEESSAAVRDALRAAAPEAQGSPDGPRRPVAERLGVFVDVQNMFYAARGQNARLDFDALLQAASRGRRLVRAVAYVVEAKEIDQSGFIALLQQKRYEVKRKDLKVRADGSFKGDWDMEIALDALEMADGLDVVVLVTGDGDFTSLVQKLKVRGPRVEVYSFPENTAKELREAADRFVSIDKRMLIKLARVSPKTAPSRSAGS